MHLNIFYNVLDHKETNQRPLCYFICIIYTTTFIYKYYSNVVVIEWFFESCRLHGSSSSSIYKALKKKMTSAFDRALGGVTDFGLAL